MGTTNLKKLALVMVAGVGGLAIAACGSSPMGPSDAGSMAALGAATASGASSAATSAKPGPQPAPVPNCAFAKDLSLAVSAVGKDHVEITSNYDLTGHGCKSLAWTVTPASRFQAFTLRFDRLNVYPSLGPAATGFTVAATTPEGQSTKLFVSAKRPRPAV